MISFLSFLIPLALASSPFSDVADTHLNQVAISYLKDHAVISGYPDGSFKPASFINRAEFTKIVVGAKLNENPVSYAASCFPDVPADQWFSSYVCYAKEQGIINGYPDGTFKPTANINVVEAVKILVSTLGVPQVTPAGTEWYSVFLESMTSNYYLPSTITALTQKITRAQMAEMVWRILEQKKDQPAATLEDLTSSACLSMGENLPSSIDMKRVRETWLGWYNEVRSQAGLHAYTLNDQLSRTATTWSEVSKSRGYMDHKRPGTTAYYDYKAIESWFEDQGLTFKNVNRFTFTENIGWGIYHCSEADCTDELIDAIRQTFDFYMGEKNDSYKPHYESVMNSTFKEIGVGLALDGNKYYLTTHYAVEINSNPLPVCSN